MSEPAISRDQVPAAAASVEANDDKARLQTSPERTVEIVSDSGEGAQTAGQLFGTVCAKMGNGVWTVELIPAEIEPPARSRAGASGIRIRFGTKPVTNMGDQADLVVAFNEQVLYSRIDQDALRPGTLLLIDDKWARHPDSEIQQDYAKALDDFRQRGYEVQETPIEAETLTLTDNPQRGKNMWVLGLLCAVYNRDLKPALDEVRQLFERRRKGEEVIALNHQLLRKGYEWGMEHLDQRFDVPSEPRAGSPRRPRPPTISRASSTRPAASSTRPRTRSPPSASPSDPPTRARRPSPSRRAPEWP
jgi:2-oxoglutarate ferredoxin oxidoreductase subunit alpha